MPAPLATDPVPIHACGREYPLARLTSRRDRVRDPTKPQSLTAFPASNLQGARRGERIVRKRPKPKGKRAPARWDERGFRRGAIDDQFDDDWRESRERETDDAGDLVIGLDP